MKTLWYEKLKNERLARGISQKDVAEQLQITRTCYSNYEQGIREPSFDLLVKICKFFNISCDYLLGLED